MTRILFVDDEPNVLEGLQRVLRPYHHEWDMRFVGGPSQALDCLELCPADVVVSDSRMPGMDGCQLLEEVKRRYPQAVRIMLSGHCDQEIVLRSVGPVHSYLSKPCDAETLKRTVMRALALRDLLEADGLKRLVTQLGGLPSLPSRYNELLAELQSSSACIRNVAGIISQDIAMTAKILQLVNSGFFGLRSRVSTPHHAVMLLGLQTLKVLTLSFNVFSQFDQKRAKCLSVDRLLNHCLAIGSATKLLMATATTDAKVLELSFTSGMLHDVGKLIFATTLSNRYRDAQQKARRERVPIAVIEREFFGASHAEMGAYLLALWSLPDALVEAVAFHHNIARSGQRDLQLAVAVHVADALVHELYDVPSEASIPRADVDYLDDIGLRERLPAWRRLIAENFRRQPYARPDNPQAQADAGRSP